MLILDAQTKHARRAAAPDARLARFLEQANRADAAFQAAELTPTLVRDGFAAMTRALCGSGPDIAVVRDDALVDQDHTHTRNDDGMLPIRLYDPDPARELPVCLYLHGGGHVAGSIAVYDPICRRLAATTNCRVVALDYRLAPEHPYPRGLDDCARALALLPAWLAAQGMGLPGGLTVAGDSGGGALTASLSAMSARKANGKVLPVALPIARQVLIYPSLDYILAQPSVQENASGYLLDARRIRWYFDQYFAENQDKDKMPDRAAASPLTMPAANLPPALVITAGFCPLRDEAYVYAERLRRAGVACTHEHLPGMIHAFLNLHTLVPDACDAVYQAIARFIRST